MITLREKFDKRMKPGTIRRNYWREYKQKRTAMKKERTYSKIAKQVTRAHKPVKTYNHDGEFNFYVPKAGIEFVFQAVNEGLSRIWQICKATGFTPDEVDFALGQLLGDRKIKRVENGLTVQYFPIDKKVKKVLYGGV